MITVLWTCHECGAIDQKAFVRERRKGEDVVHWMNEVQIEVGNAHSLYSINCQCRKADVKIPIGEDEGKGIGER